MTIIEIYKNHIYNRFKDLLRAKNIKDLDNNDLCKIFEYFSCIKLTEEYKTAFYEYADIDPEFKELNQMTRNDTGIDCSNVIDTIVQCKLRKDTLTWKECSTFFASQNLYNEELNETIVRWKKLIIARNSECKLALNLQEKKRLFTDKPYSRDEIINYCEKLLETPPMTSIANIIKYVAREYQEELIKKIIDGRENIIISLPTGTGKNFIIVHSLEPNKKYLILVPRIILMEQMQDEIKKHKPKLKNKIQLIGDSKNVFDETKDITICCYNSVKIVEEHSTLFHKIFIDEAHHIHKPEIYQNDEQDLENPARKDDDEYFDSDEEYSDDEDIPELEDSEDSENDNEETPVEDDNENDDEIQNESSYIDIIRNFTKLNNNVYLSATIDAQEGFTYYEKNIRDMINNKYLSDYTINIPIFTDDPTNKNICDYLLKEYRNIIIYCNTKKEGKQINKLMNELQNKSSDYIDCDTTKTKRKTIIEKFKSGELPFLVNVRILVEGFDAPITKGVCFMHLPSSKTTLIQIIGRALRLHEMKTIANVILPFSLKDDESSIINFMKVIAKNDSRIKKSLESKKVGGYISLVKVIEDEIDEDYEENEELRDINLKYELIYDSMCIMKNSEEIFVKRLEELKKYIDDNGMRPSKHSKDKNIKSIAQWLGQNKHNYNKKIKNMKDEKIYDLFTNFINEDKYKVYFLSNEEEWINNLEEVKKYIDNNNKKPSIEDENDYIKKIGNWLNTQKYNYKKKKDIMVNIEIYTKWYEFINNEKYNKYFILNEDEWINNLEEVKKYIDKNNKRPNQKDKNKDIKKLGIWIGTQQYNYNIKRRNMLNHEIYTKWTEFINNDKYKLYLVSKEDIWNQNLEKVKKYIDSNNKKPSNEDKNKDVKSMAKFIYHQIENYKYKTNSMANTIMYNKWTEVINNDKYKLYLLSKEDIWNQNLEKVKKYIDNNNKKPSTEDSDKDIKQLGTWISNQLKNYKQKINIMSNLEIYNNYNEFINNDKYKTYFISNEDVWKQNLEKVKKYIDNNNKRPSRSDKNDIIKFLCNWIGTQQKIYKTKTTIMSNPEIYNLWTNFINDPKYKDYF
jgi:superfamily II DNA or RNA helicase/antitoxin component HigA of HigAB toxin-antitoxin module